MALATATSSATATAPPRVKKRKYSPEPVEPVTDLGNPSWDEETMSAPKLPPKMSFRCPLSIDTVFDAPPTSHVEAFYDTRSGAHLPFDDLPEADKVAWAESFHDNKVLMGLIIYSQLFPALLKSRIKLNAPTYHWSQLDPASAKGATKLAQRQDALARIRREDFTRSVFRGLPYRIDTSVDILTYMKMSMDSEDERFRFFTGREFSFICSERGDVNGSSVFSSCSMALSLLWFATVILGRPCSLESVILPLSTTERQSLEKRFGCPSQFFDGPIRGLQTNWGAVFATVGTMHRNIDYTMLERASEQKYVDGLHVADAYAVHRATVSARGDSQSIAALVESYKLHSKHGTDSGSVVGVMDVIRSKGVEGIGRMDGSVLGTIMATYGERACRKVQESCTNTLQGGATLFDDSVSGKLGEVMAHFDREMVKGRKKAKVERTVRANMDPAGLNKKVEAGRMLDPCDPKSVELMHGMLTGLSGRVWKPLKSLIGGALGVHMEYPSAFLQISRDEEETLYKHLVASRVVYTDIANLCTLLVLSLSFQRSQVLRDSTVDEFVLVPDGTHYKFSFKNRRFKTASSGGSSSAPPVSHFLLTPDQSMIVKFISSAGHRFCNVQDVWEDETRRLFINSKGQNWNQKDIGSRFKKIGVEWLGIGNFGPHTCRSFWSTHALNSGQVGGANLEDFSSFLQVSSATLRNSYMSAGANTAAHALGSEVLGSVVNAACTGSTTKKGARPYGKQLGKRRLEFIAKIRASLEKYGGNGRRMFRDLLRKRKETTLASDEAWFQFQATYFGDGEERLFKRFLDKNVTGV